MYSAVQVQLKCQANKGDFVCFCGKSKVEVPLQGVGRTVQHETSLSIYLQARFKFSKQATKILHDFVVCFNNKLTFTGKYTLLSSTVSRYNLHKMNFSPHGNNQLELVTLTQNTLPV